MKIQLTCILIMCLGTIASAAERPNIVFMMSDDQAWNGLSVPMHPDLEWSKSSIVDTPNLEKLASQGMRFSAAYAPASVCSPTRVSLQTGKSQNGDSVRAAVNGKAMVNDRAPVARKPLVADSDSSRIRAKIEFHLKISMCGRRRSLLVRKAPDSTIPRFG